MSEVPLYWVAMLIAIRKNCPFLSLRVQVMFPTRPLDVVSVGRLSKTPPPHPQVAASYRGTSLIRKRPPPRTTVGP